jgi:hypothetical protein
MISLTRLSISIQDLPPYRRGVVTVTGQLGNCLFTRLLSRASEVKAVHWIKS